MRWWRLVGFLVAALMLVGACGQQSDDTQGQGDNTKDDTTESGGTETGAVSDLQDVNEATVYIQAAGGLQDLERAAGEETRAGTGTGFIISPDGLTVTANHVVTGAGYLEVYLPTRDDDQPISAEVLGVSECSDLAVIKLEDGGYDYLEWRDGTIEAGLPVTAAGFPEDVENPDQVPPPYRISRGIINTTEASGESSWASVDKVIEHEATLRGGNSGGPLVDNNARVVGVNYAGIEETEQQFAISRDEAQTIIDELKTGKDVDSIGVNGQAVAEDPESETKGAIQVFSVETGSPADRVGIQGITATQDPGHFTQDFITKLEGTDLAVNGDMEEYCKVMRGRTDQPLSVEVLRIEFNEDDEVADAELLTGVLNGTPEDTLRKQGETPEQPPEG